MYPCKHLDHKTEYVDCKLVQINEFSCPVKYWERQNVPYKGAAKNVQFCGLGKGRIDGIFQCYDESGMHCYQGED
jgi:hypothetical protein